MNGKSGGNVRKNNGKIRPRLILLFSIVLFTTWAITGYELYQLQDDGLKQERVASQNLVRALSAFTETSISNILGLLSSVNYHFKSRGIDGRFSPEGIEELRSIAVASNLVASLVTVDREGVTDHAVVSDGSGGFVSIGREIAVGDREYFKHFAESWSPERAQETYISAPIKGRDKGKWLIPIVRARVGEDGTFQGVIVATFLIKNFQTLYGSFDLSESGIVSLLRNDGVVLARIPFDEDKIGHSIMPVQAFQRRFNKATDSIEMAGVFDGKTRMVSYQKLTSFPLVVVTVKMKSSVVQAIRSHQVKVLVVSFMGSIFLFLYFRVFYKQASHRELEYEHHRALFEGVFRDIPDAIVLTDPDRRIFMSNPGIKRVFGYDEHEIIGKKTEVLYESREEFERQGLLRFNLSAALKLEPYSVNYRRKNGEVFPGETVGTKIIGMDGETLAFIGLMRDISGRKQSEEHLFKALEEAKKSNKAKSEFLASMSHELRTPLNAVLGFAQMLQFDAKNPLSPAQSLHVDSILEGGDHLLELVNDILDLARIEADQVSISLGKVNAAEVAKDCINLIGPLGKPRNIKVVNNVKENGLPELRTDQTRFKQSLLNLLSNAVKYNKDGGTVTLGAQEASDGYLRIWVSDTGHGIAQDDYDGVFQIFNRLTVDPMISKDGTGIGLPVTKMLVERMSGRVGFDSEVGVGSTFWIELPLASNEDVLIWANNLRVGVDAIDRDHQRLISLTNQISYDDISEAELHDVFEELVNYTHYHFRREEAIMEVCGYPGLKKHLGLHIDLATQVNKLADEWRKERNPELLLKFRKFMRGWLIDHVMKVDSKIAEYTKGKGQEILAALEIVETSRRYANASVQMDKP